MTAAQSTQGGGNLGNNSSNSWNGGLDKSNSWGGGGGGNDSGNNTSWNKSNGNKNAGHARTISAISLGSWANSRTGPVNKNGGW
jgi:hypothetical protein